MKVIIGFDGSLVGLAKEVELLRNKLKEAHTEEVKDQWLLQESEKEIASKKEESRILDEKIV